ncbi:MAG: ABC transporter permease [Bacteroidetes bacterium]|nr:MAG: ABC transporter permease [Bacteroidota bacterium]REK05349.1 MAG: ABC transporter permease [Bacteroidota bacterium]REK32723.1 MAG: ABC transporter permease [Bacteroidota bacterium]REK49082.1 MAG: ABC transporter permease [Bacteroidota bacterium]
MDKVFLVIQREYLTRVRKKSFLIMTILGPLLMGAVFLSVLLLDKVDTEEKRIAVIDETKIFCDKFKDNERIKFTCIDGDLSSARKSGKEKEYFGILYIPATNKLSLLEKAVVLYSESQPGFELVSKIKFTIEKEINTQKYLEAGIDEAELAKIRTDVEIRTRDMEDKETSTPLTSGLGFAGGLLIYLFIFIYGAMVMRGVMEEKTNRIVEVIISSVKPFQLMMGKIIGVALVGLTQFMLWVVLTTMIYAGVSSYVFKGKSDSEKVESMMQMNSSMSDKLNPGASGNDAVMTNKFDKLSTMIDSVNFPLIIGMFVFFFLGGYLLYSALFAAVGAAVDSETDTQQFMFPITIPLIIAYVASVSVMNNPQGNVAFWFSVIPFTSPIVMMVRIPFGVPVWHIVLSMVFLVGGFIFTTWLASKIYRTGILMYGKKVSYRELWKWLRYRN